MQGRLDHQRRLHDGLAGDRARIDQFLEYHLALVQPDDPIRADPEGGEGVSIEPFHAGHGLDRDPGAVEEPGPRGHVQAGQALDEPVAVILAPELPEMDAAPGDPAGTRKGMTDLGLSVRTEGEGAQIGAAVAVIRLSSTRLSPTCTRP